MQTIAEQRLMCADAFMEQLDADEALATIQTHSRSLGEISAKSLGLWEAEPGQASETESSEVFLILVGSGTLTFQDQSIISLRPGVVVKLCDGDQTVWTVTTRLRQLYLA